MQNEGETAKPPRKTVRGAIWIFVYSESSPLVPPKDSFCRPAAVLLDDRMTPLKDKNRPFHRSKAFLLHRHAIVPKSPLRHKAKQISRLAKPRKIAAFSALSSVGTKGGLYLWRKINLSTILIAYFAAASACLPQFVWRRTATQTRFFELFKKIVGESG